MTSPSIISWVPAAGGAFKAAGTMSRAEDRASTEFDWPLKVASTFSRLAIAALQFCQEPSRRIAKGFHNDLSFAVVGLNGDQLSQGYLPCPTNVLQDLTK